MNNKEELIKMQLSQKEEQVEEQHEDTKGERDEQAQLKEVDEQQVTSLLQEAIDLPDLSVTVSGLAGRFPKSDNVNEFERNLRDGVDMINDEDNSRFTCRLWNLPPRAGRIKDLSRFDANFFGYSKDEANYVDYQMRLLYEVVYESILDAGINPASLRASNTGVFFGFHCNEFEIAMVDDPSFKSNGYYGQFATRIAQYFDLRGVTVTFDAACASGFVGLHHGVQAIATGQCDRAIVCSSNIPIHPTGSFIFLQMQMLSPTGYSRFLDSRADGYVKSESCVSVLLQRKDLALRNYANFMATMTCVDGFKREGITFPSDKSQESLIRATKELAGISTNHVEYFEAHGTGTPAGDPQEAKAIANVYNRKANKHELSNEDQQYEQEHSKVVNYYGNGLDERRQIGPILVGSVKTNMGHSEAASGLCALTKVALMLEHEIIYPSLHYSEPNANIESLKDGRIHFVGEKRPLRAKVVPLSCYGFGGSNVHAIVKANELSAIESPSLAEITSLNHAIYEPTVPRLVLMFGRGEQQLNHFFDKLLDKDNYQTKNCLTDDFLLLVDSLNADKIDRLMTHRGYIIIDPSTDTQLTRSIVKCELAKPKATGKIQHFQEARETCINLIFPGLGCNYKQMAAGLVKFQPFWSTIERITMILDAFDNGQNHLVQLLTSDERPMESLSVCEKFCSIVAYQMALVNLFVGKNSAMNITRINNIFGHSLGDIVAAYATGIFNECEAISVAYHLGKILDKLEDLIAGRMVAVGVSELDAEKLIKKFMVSAEIGHVNHKSAETIAISCINGPQSVTLSGSTSDMDAFCQWLREQNIFFTMIESRVALHNRLIMNEIIELELRKELLKVLDPLSNFDNLRTNWITAAETTLGTEEKNQSIAHFFARSMCEKVDFLKALDEGYQSGVYLELGPASLFEAQFELWLHEHQRKQLQQNNNNQDISGNTYYLRCMRKDTKPDEQIMSLLKCLGELYQCGLNNMSLRNIYPSMKAISCTRRQTPSLSSLIEWQHEEQHFVPRYPLQFSKSSAKCEMPVDVMQERDKYLLGHCVEGRCLFPATGYLFLIWRVFSFTKRKIYDACFHDVEQELVPIEFHQVRLLRAVIMNNRVAQLYIHIEESTGRFEIKEGGSVVVEGWARSPQENPTGLMYESTRKQIEAEQLPVEMVREDIYKQFRVSGYDYGDTFQNIFEASSDGRYCRVNFNGHFVALTDSVLQSIFLAVTQYAPSGGLFLPTCFDYVRFQPDIIIAKLRRAGMKLDRSDGSLNTIAKREIMTKIMQRDSGIVDLNEQATTETPTDNNNQAQDTNITHQNESEPLPEKTCFFETYCDPITGIIITDGIEMRGIKASPAPRKIDTKDVMLESYQFVADTEMPIDDELLTGFGHGFVAKYKNVCNSLALKVLQKQVLVDDSIRDTDGLSIEESEATNFKEKHLKCMFSKLSKPQNLADKAGVKDDTKFEDNHDGTEEKQQQEYDIKKNGNLTLMSVLEQLEYYADANCLTHERIREIVSKNRLHLMKDILQGSFSSERLMRPIMEIVMENSCQRKSKLSVLEINEDDGIMKMAIDQLVNSIEPTFTIDYLLAHPDPPRISNIAPANEVKTHVLKDIQTLLTDQRLRDPDLVLYKDTSCYDHLPKGLDAAKNESSELEREESRSPKIIIKSLSEGLKWGGFLLVLMRSKFTLAENILLSVGSSCKQNSDEPDSSCRQISSINSLLAERVDQLRNEARDQNLIEVSSKCDLNGCLALLFRKPDTVYESTKSAKILMTQKKQLLEHILLRITHRDERNIDQWIVKLKEYFKQPASPTSSNNKDGNVNEQTPEVQISTKAGSQSDGSENRRDDGEENQVEKTKIIWLCAVDTKQEKASGLIGMMQSLRKELGSTRLRCFYDQYTFVDHDHDEISIDLIGKSDHFKEALRRDLIWNCVSTEGHMGSYRHFTLDDYLSYANCLCDSQKEEENDVQPETEINYQQSSEHESPKACYVNNAARGDLSSFTWYEAPCKYTTIYNGQNNDIKPDSIVQVCYSALNFRDIMLATGRLPLDSLPIKLAMSDCHIGLEFSGYDLDTGKRVMGMVPARGIATQIACRQGSSLKIEIPDGLDMCEAATIPVVYSTVIMALIYRGKMQSGESILIHAGSGGVGQAAIRVALHFGLEVFTTVGTDDKRQFLLDEFGRKNQIGLNTENENKFLSPDHIFSSRNTQFESEIMRMTSGRGVDLVLNSLADDKLQASVRTLADGGRFLEIGKYDMATNARLELLNLDHNKTFHGILLDKLFDLDDTNPEFRRQLDCILQTVRDGFELGFVKPIKFTLFKRHQIEEAFRFMASGKHIGKILIEINKPKVHETGSQKINNSRSDHTRAKCVRLRKLACVPRFQMDPQACHIVTGGLGGFGLELIKWLVQQGGRHFLITSRNGFRTGYQKITIKRLEAQGARFNVVLYDTTTREGVIKLVDDALQATSSHRIGSIFHLAMVLKDSLLENMTSDDFALVCRPKITTCELLDDILQARQINPDHFVTFSSVTSGLGNAGQANYAYANSLIERICERRRTRGEHGLAIQWGAIGDVGAAYENLGGNNVVVGGTIPQRMPSCQATLAKLLCSPFPICLSVVPVNRGQSASGLGAKGDLVGAIFHVLGIKDASKVSDEATLGELGLDSLMAVEIRQYIEREYDMTLNMQEIRALTIGKIREIGEKGQAAAKKVNIKDDNNQAQSDNSGINTETTNNFNQQQPKVVASYGTKLHSNDRSLNATDIAKPPIEKQQQLANLTSNDNLSKLSELQTSLAVKLDNNSRIQLDINFIGGFKPELCLPRRKFKKLNTAHLSDHHHTNLSDCSINYNHNYSINHHLNHRKSIASSSPTTRETTIIDSDESKSRPVFFLPPIYGSFELLEPICKLIDRPCIGLNWSRAQARSTSMTEAVDSYISNLEQWKWTSDSSGNDHNNGEYDTSNNTTHQVDLIGYSYGATIAFEIMVKLHENWIKQTNDPKTSSNDKLSDGKLSRTNKSFCLKPGQLILLDGSPKQIELGSQLMGALNRKAQLSETDKIDEMLMAYVLSHAKHLALSTRLDLLELQDKLKVTRDNEQKLRLASETLCQLLGLATTETDVNRTKVMQLNTTDTSNEPILGPLIRLPVSLDSPDLSDSGAASDTSTSLSDSELSEESGPLDSDNGRDDLRAEMELAMEAFMRRYDIVDKYKCLSKLPSKAVLIRAGEVYLKKKPIKDRQSQSDTMVMTDHDHDIGSATTKPELDIGVCKQDTEVDSDDLGLSSVVKQVELHILPGNHQTFLEKNRNNIARIINSHLVN